LRAAENESNGKGRPTPSPVNHRKKLRDDALSGSSARIVQDRADKERLLI
jgi:hypothetical protein